MAEDSLVNLKSYSLLLAITQKDDPQLDSETETGTVTRLVGSVETDPRASEQECV